MSFCSVFLLFMLEEMPFFMNGLSSEYNVTNDVGWSSFCLTISLYEDITLDWSLLTESIWKSM